MNPKIRPELLEHLQDTGQPPPWRCKAHLPRGRTIYGVEITANGEIIRVGDRPVYSPADLGIRISDVEELTLY